MIYSIGHNIAGYLPETDVAWFADRDQAAIQLTSDMREYADRDDEAAWDALPTDPAEAREHGYAVTEDGVDYGDDAPSMLATVESILADDGPEHGTREWLAYVTDERGRSVAFWLSEHQFNAEYALTRHGVRAEVAKAGGGTLGQAYEGDWSYVVRDAVGDLVTCGLDFHSGVELTHYQAASRILDMVEDGAFD